ncbi:uncharacterized protein LOC121263780 isoform X3 [Juglans microcarpa x Juglans regia]|uniref:uncharacterized protein LOC121263780 isoform X3 n=1 Tax=Juglans microcarpa x Juglans regia TaxID=2249226 RepID=UPI001B7F68D4|nr:uncharacterized protein LOC121263780 isoform X3 [Juglans microcarpa x Juglans regia]
MDIWSLHCLDFVMGISKTEVNLRRLLAAVPHQQNLAKLVHYVATLREQVEQVAEETTPEGLPRVSKAKVNEYSEKIKLIASKLTAPLAAQPDMQVSEEPFAKTSTHESPSRTGVENHLLPTPGIRKRSVYVNLWPGSNSEDRVHDNAEDHSSAPVKLDASSQAHIKKHRKLQEDFIDEMVGLAQQLKESSLMISQSVENTEKVNT